MNSGAIFRLSAESTTFLLPQVSPILTITFQELYSPAFILAYYWYFLFKKEENGYDTIILRIFCTVYQN